MDIYNFISFVGIFILMGIAWACSNNRKKINFRVIFFGIIIQCLTAIFIFISPVGSKFFMFLNNIVIKILNSASAGSQFLFGRLALGPGEVNPAGETSLGFILAFQALPTIIFFSSLISILYYFNIMPRIIKILASIFTKFMKISGAESLVAASNIFVGVESSLTVKPYLKEMTSSEFCTILSVGMATVSSNILALYVLFLHQEFPSIAAHLISASLLSAPAALITSKIIYPECQSPKTLGTNIQAFYQKDQTLFEAIIHGANSGLKMIVGIVALLIAVLGIIALFDLLLSLIGDKINIFLGASIDFSLKGLLGYIFYPLTFIIGVPLEDVGIISKIIGERMIATEVVAYQDLAIAIKNNAIISKRSILIASYALCGFAHVASMSIFVGGISAIVPDKTHKISKVALRALIASTLACLMTAAIAGAFYNNKTYLLM